LLTGERGGSVIGAKSYDCEKACSSINHSILSALIKKKKKFSSYIKKFRWDRLHIIYEEGLPKILGNAQI
jgi:hypothetical protein